MLESGTEWLIAGGFGILILGVWLTSLVSRKDNSAVLISLGILGTFVGIAYGLWNFNVEDIDTSVPQLLAGMKTAFLTSVTGMAASLILKLLLKMIFVFTRKTDDAAPAELLNQTLNKILHAIQGNSDKTLTQQIQELQTALIGDGEKSLTTEMTKLRTDFNDNHKALIREFQNFAEEVSKNSVDAIVEALEKVIRDFNEKINEQFGENFKQLNAAVKELVAWQDKYREHVEVLTQQFEHAQTGIETTKNAIQDIQKSSEAIPESMEKLNDVLNIAKSQTDELNQHLKAFEELKQNAVEAIPVIRDELQQTIEGWQSKVETAFDDFSKITSESMTLQKEQNTKLGETIAQQQTMNQQLKDSVAKNVEQIATLGKTINAGVKDTISEAMQDISKRNEQNIELLKQEMTNIVEMTTSEMKDTLTSQQTMNRELKDSVAKNVEQIANLGETINAGVKETIDQAMQAISRHNEQNLNQMERTMTEIVRQTNQKIEVTIQTLDQEMQKEVQNVIQTMGNNLARLNAKIISDHQEFIRNAENFSQRLNDVLYRLRQ